MSDNLRVTTPVTTNDTIGKLRPSKEPNNIDVINPAKVTPPNQNEQTGKENQSELLMNRNSVFTKYVMQLQQTPALTQTLQKMMFDIFSKDKMIQRDSSVSTLLKQLSSSLSMDKSEILKNLMFQQNNHTKFAGAFFDALRSLSGQTKDVEFDLHLANFLKAYDGFFSMSDTTKSIMNQLETLKHQIPKSYADKLQAVMDELEPEQPMVSVEKNLMVLKNKIIPMLSDYVSRLNDYGKARNTITMLVHDLARLNTSSKEDLVNKFDSLLEYCKYDLKLPDDKINSIQNMFAQNITQSREKAENNFFDSLISLLADGSKKSVSNSNQSMYQDICHSLLLDNSVYMPFTHLFLPINYNGKFMFSELWIEKDKEESRSSEQKDLPKTTNLYLTFDIKDLGYFEATIGITQMKTSIRLCCPPALKSKSREISTSIAQIFTQNGLTPENIVLSMDNAPKVYQQILQKVYERKDTIDVTV